MPMERPQWLKKIRENAEALYDHISPQYWVTFGLDVEETHRVYFQKFVERVLPGGKVLSAACGAGRFDGMLLEAGYDVVGIDQSAGMLARAKERFPEVEYVKMSLHDMHFRETFDGVICMDAMEHIFPEDYPGILRGFQEALKAGGVLYFTADREEEADFDLHAQYERAKALGLPVVFGEVMDEAAYEWAMKQPELSGEASDIAVYHYYPPLAKVRAWIEQAGFAVEAEGAGSGFHHFVLRKK
jgi:2-polyprenyl-3-methyl-5-hydroxy-6-metoxy-1,4-benzoquinol methylase